MSFSILKAKYDILVDVLFDVNGGSSVSYDSKTYTVGKKYSELPSATKTDYVLLGWYTDAISGTKITKDSLADGLTVRLYAHYRLMTNYTAFNVTTTSSYKTFGFYSLTKKSSSSSVFIDWGDGNAEEITSYSQIYHTYTSVGNFIVKVSDDITQFCLSNNSSTYYEKVRYTFKSIATRSTSLSNSLPNYCFYYCAAMNSLLNLGNITSIGTYCFAYCSSLTSFTGLGNITILTSYSFYYCTGLTSLNTLPTSVTTYQNYCLAYSHVSNLSRVRSTDTLNTYCFAYLTSLTNLSTLPARSSLPSYCFYYCTGLTTADLSSWTSLTSIPSYCFYYCYYLNSVKLPSSVTSIGSYAFEYCLNGQLVADLSLTQITALPSYCFGYCYNLKEVKLPNTLRNINDNAFRQCYNSYFTSIGLPASLTSIGTYAFYYCRYLKSISCLADTAPTVLSTTFGDSTTYYTGRSTYSTGNNTLYVKNPNNYKTSYWNSVLLDSTKCGFHTQSIDKYDLTNGRIEGLKSYYLSSEIPVNPSISVYNSANEMLTENTDYSKVLVGNDQVGTAYLSAVGINPYKNYLSASFRIVGEEPKYTELEYIESDGNLWINTNIKTTATGRWIGKITTYSGGSRFIGNSTGVYSGSIVLATPDSGNRYATFYGSWNDSYRTILTSYPRTISIDFQFLPNSQYLYIDNILHQTASRTAITTFGDIYLFWAGYNYKKTNRIHYLDIYSGDILTGSFIPVKDPNGVVCMYDKVSETYFYNKGTGNFIAGPERELYN